MWNAGVEANCPRLYALRGKWEAARYEIDAHEKVLQDRTKPVCLEVKRKLDAYRQSARSLCTDDQKAAPTEVSTCLADKFQETTAIPLNEGGTGIPALDLDRICPDEVDIALAIRKEDEAIVQEFVRREEEAREAIGRAEQERRMRRYEREDRARKLAEKDPSFQRAGFAISLCSSYGTYAGILNAEARMHEVDEASGTVDLKRRRSYAEIKIYLKRAIKMSEENYRRIGGALPGGSFVKKKAFWCSQPGQSSIVTRYLDELERREEPAP
ncbi:MAG: hypothetical protein HY698_03945 [Deltaproteobacteria bacterium]|nr:hypothetical protein [Deltaproteobacteria bacterium]